jgi:hypothetical protein
MADYIKTNEIQTRISLKYDSYSNWSSKNPVLLKGEVAIATVSAGTTTAPQMQNLPNVVMKVGDGTSKYNALPFVSALAADVYEWAKAATKPSYAISEISNALEYRLATIDAANHKYALQARKAGSEEAWAPVADSAIDLSGLVASVANHETRIGTVESDLNTAETGLKARMTAAEAALENITKADGGEIGTAINTKIASLDAELDQTAGADGLALHIKEVDGVITELSGSIKANTYDAYGAASTAKQELLNNEIKANADAIDVIEGNDAGKSMRQVATAVVEGLDATVNQTAGNDGLALEVVQENGVLKSVSGSIKANTYDTYGAAAAVQGSTTHTVAEAYALADAAQTADEVAAAVKVEEDARKAAIQALDYTGYEAGSAEGVTISFVGTVSESDGVISATKRDLVFTDAYSASNPAATKKYVDDAVKTGVADLNGAMHFEGVKDALPELTGEHGYVNGDVIIVGVTEYVYSNGAWVQLGDEGALGAALQALKLNETGAVDSTLVISQTNGLVSAKAEKIQIAESQVTGLADDLSKKLDAETYNTFKSGEFATLSGKVDTLNGDASTAGSVAKKIADSLASLDMDEKGAADKTLKIKQVDGTVSAEEVAIQIAMTQVTDLDKEFAKKLDKSVYDTFKSEEFAPVKTAVDNMSTTIADQIKALDSTKSQAAGADGLALSITQTDGVITSISGSIAAETYDTYGAAKAVQGETTHTVAEAYALADAAQTADEVTTAISNAIGALDKEDIAVEGEFLTAAPQANGVISVSRAKVNVKHLAQDENSYVVFNCGTSEINI